MPSSRECFRSGFKANRAKNFDKAEKFYRKALEIDSEYSMAWNNLGWLLYDQKQSYNEAFRCFNNALKHDRDNFYAWNNLGVFVYQRKKKYRKAEKYWKKALKIFPYYTPTWNNLGVLYKTHLRKPEKALECFKMVDKYKTAIRKVNEHTYTNNLVICKECGNPFEIGQIICDRCGWNQKLAKQNSE